jgi:hypothetical protein
MADAIYAPQQFRLAIAEEVAFGTAITAQGSFFELDIINPTQPDMASGVVEDVRKRSDGKRVMSNTDTYRSTVGGTYTIPFECIATGNTLDLLLYGVMQDLESEAATTPYQKIFHMDEGTAAPDFSVNAGKYFTVLGADAENWSATSCILKSLTLSASPGTNGGRLTASGEFITGFDIDISSVTATPASWVGPITKSNDFYPFQLYANSSVAAANLVPYSFSITLTNNAVRVGNSAGLATNYHLPMFEANAEIVAKLDAITDDMIDTYRLDPTAGSAEVAVIMDWGSDGADGHLKFLMNAIYTGPTTRDYGAESGVGVTLSYQGVDDGSNKALVATIANALDRAW